LDEQAVKAIIDELSKLDGLNSEVKKLVMASTKEKEEL
jgi:hypothetical protein